MATVSASGKSVMGIIRASNGGLNEQKAYLKFTGFDSRVYWAYELASYSDYCVFL